MRARVSFLLLKIVPIAQLYAKGGSLSHVSRLAFDEKNSLVMQIVVSVF